MSEEKRIEFILYQTESQYDDYDCVRGQIITDVREWDSLPADEYEMLALALRYNRQFQILTRVAFETSRPGYPSVRDLVEQGRAHFEAETKRRVAEKKAALIRQQKAAERKAKKEAKAKEDKLQQLERLKKELGME